MNEMIIRYKINDSKIRIFGNKFLENNKYNCKLIINHKE